METEEGKFKQTLDKGLKILDEEIEKYYKANGIK